MPPPPLRRHLLVAVAAAAAAVRALVGLTASRPRSRPRASRSLEHKAFPASLPVVSERQLYRRYFEVVERVVEHPNGEHVAYDLAGHPPSYAFVVVFPFDSATRSVTLIREWQQGLNEWWWQLPTGAHDPRKARSREESARFELEEEARLAGGQWRSLLPRGSPGIIESKWCRNRFTPFLAVDAKPKPNPRPRDAEELIVIEPRVPVRTLRELLAAGRLTPPSAYCAAMGLARLEADGLL